MNALIREATHEDKLSFLILWADFLQEHEKMGSDTKASLKSLEFYENLFDGVSENRLDGVCLLAEVNGESVGTLLWADAGMDVVERTERQVFGWGAYTDPSHRRKGISRRLRERAIQVLDEMGVQVTIGSALLVNRAGCESSRAIDFVPTTLLGALNIHEAAEKIRQRDALGGHGRFTDGFYWEGHCPLCGRDDPETSIEEVAS